MFSGNKRTDPLIYDLYDRLEKKNPQTSAQRMSQGEAETIRRVLRSVQQHEEERLSKGFNAINFTLGVTNTILIAWFFGAHPEHFWLLFLAESTILLPTKIYQDMTAKPNRVFYYFDYCWMANFLIVTCLFYLLFNGDEVSKDMRQHMLCAIVGIGCGVLLGATAALPFCAIVFHDSAMMTSLFIHIIPPMLIHTLVWDAEAIREAWPSVFHLDWQRVSILPDESFQDVLMSPKLLYGTVVGDSLLIYGCWFIVYSLWMFLFGLRMTRTVQQGNTVVKPRFDTVFYSLMRDTLGSVVSGFWGRSAEETKRCIQMGDFEFRDFGLYMACHALLSIVATNILPHACLSDKHIHSTILWVFVMLCVFRGARRYVYWVTSSSSRALSNEYREILMQQQHPKKM